MSEVDSQTATNSWDRFWFTPTSSRKIATVRGWLCLITAIYFFSCFADVGFWFGTNGVFSTEQTASFLQTADLQNEARWVLSPLFMIDSIVGSSVWIYYLYLVIGIALCPLVATGRGGRWATWGLWVMLAGWANRLLFLSGVTETLLSLGLFAAAIAPPASSIGAIESLWAGKENAGQETASKEAVTKEAAAHWANGFAMRLMAVQITLFGLATLATMLASPIWWNGLGSFALVAPVEDRSFDLSAALASTLMHEGLTHFITLALPIGLVLGWSRPRSLAAFAILTAWCLTVAVLGSHWLYGATFAAMSWSLYRGGVSSLRDG